MCCFFTDRTELTTENATDSAALVARKLAHEFVAKFAPFSDSLRCIRARKGACQCTGK